MIYTQRFAALDVTSGPGDFLMFTVPDDGATWVLRSATLSNEDAAAAQLILYVTQNSGSRFTLFRDPAFAATSAAVWNGRCVLEAGEELYLYTSQVDATAQATGYRLD